MISGQGVLSSLGSLGLEAGMAGITMLADSPFLAVPSGDEDASSYSPSEDLLDVVTTWKVADAFKPSTQSAQGAQIQTRTQTISLLLTVTGDKKVSAEAAAKKAGTKMGPCEAAIGSPCKNPYLSAAPMDAEKVQTMAFEYFIGIENARPVCSTPIQKFIKNKELQTSVPSPQPSPIRVGVARFSVRLYKPFAQAKACYSTSKTVATQSLKGERERLMQIFARSGLADRSICSVTGGFVTGVYPAASRPGFERPSIVPARGEQKIAGNFPATLSFRKIEEALGASAVSKIKAAGRLPEKIFVKGQVEGKAAIASYIRVGGEYIFAGWNSASANGINVRPESARIERYERTLPQVLGLGMPGGETAPKNYNLQDENARLERMFVQMLLAQIIRGPSSAADDSFRMNFNSMVEHSFHPGITTAIGPDDWNGFIQEALRLAVMYAGTFGENGFETIDEIEATAAAMLGIDTKTFAAWEDHFAFSAISMQLTKVLDIWFGRTRDDGLNPTLTAALESDISSSHTGIRDHISALDRASTEWIILALSSINDPNTKTEEVKNFIEMKFSNGLGPVAGLALAMVVAHSDLSRKPAETDHVGLWSVKDIEELIGKVMTSGAWAIVSHRFFRSLIAPSLQSAINRTVTNANYNNAIAKIRALDVGTVGAEELLNAVDETGMGDTIMWEALERMGKNGIGIN